MTTDGEFLVITELAFNPFAVDPLKYDHRKLDPIPIRLVSLPKLRNEIYALNRHTIEVFDNTGLPGFSLSSASMARNPKGHAWHAHLLRV